MGMFWRIESFPEMQHLSSEDRKRLVRDCAPRRYLFGMIMESLLWGGGYVAAVSGGVTYCMGMPDVLIGGASWGGFVLGAALVYQFKLIRLRGQMRIHLEKLARQQRLPMCLNCGYDHEGLVSDTCPECGMRLLPTDDPDARR